ncbi:nucleotidyltransferase domain-containing protein [Kitasatospora xanthocidica]|uniref:nucleotidyltransferase domain-containing protein n=1 Tax=Kitasatospora xanthocidica TaxID=83382 RepID=UPI0036EA1F9C
MVAQMIDQARRLVGDRFPDALAVLLAGSAATGTATVTSDLDLAVLVADGGETHRETVRFEGRAVELFVHTGTGPGGWVRRAGAGRGRCGRRTSSRCTGPSRCS